MLRNSLTTVERLQEFQRQQDEYRRLVLMSGDSPEFTQVVVLPPPPPVLFDASAVLADLDYPGSLVPCAGEPFFMACAGLQVSGELGAADGRRVALYLKKRDRLAAALREKLAASASVAPELRQRGLQEFATRQEADLRGLEKEAEAIRQELAGYTEGAALALRRDAVKEEESPGFVEYCSVLLAAEFQAGLSLEQRELLHAIAVDALLDRKPAAAGDAPPLLSLLPATARLARPRIEDEAVAAKLRQFESLRDSLRAELRRVVLAETKQAKSRRTKQFAALAQTQAAGFTELQRLAEELRPALLIAVGAGPQPDSSLPASLVRQVGGCLVKNAALRHEANRRQRAFALEFDLHQVRLATRNGIPVIEVLPPDPAAAAAAKGKPVDKGRLARLEAANAELAQGYRSLALEMEAATREVAHYRDSLDPAQAPELARLTARLARAHAVAQVAGRFRDYRDAVLLPGLSPAQRRLLLQASLGALEKHRLETMD